MSKKRGLGKGIGALIPDIGTENVPDRDRVKKIPIEEIKANPFQPRKNFTEEKMIERYFAISFQICGELNAINNLMAYIQFALIPFRLNKSY